MKNFITTIIVVFMMSFTTTAQEKLIKEVGDNLYTYTENTIKDEIHQTGFYENVNGELERNGTWKLYVNGELKTEAIYENDKLKSLIVDGVEYSAKDLYIFKLESKIKDLTNNK